MTSEQIKEALSKDSDIKVIFLCSPGNPSGTTISLDAVRSLLDYEPFKGIVVIDEAYIDFAGEAASAVSLIKDYANICVMQTLSKSFGLAAIRCARVFDGRGMNWADCALGLALRWRSPH